MLRRLTLLLGQVWERAIALLGGVKLMVYYISYTYWPTHTPRHTRTRTCTCTPTRTHTTPAHPHHHQYQVTHTHSLTCSHTLYVAYFTHSSLPAPPGSPLPLGVVSHTAHRIHALSSVSLSTGPRSASHAVEWSMYWSYIHMYYTYKWTAHRCVMFLAPSAT